MVRNLHIFPSISSHVLSKNPQLRGPLQKQNYNAENRYDYLIKMQYHYEFTKLSASEAKKPQTDKHQNNIRNIIYNQYKVAEL